MVSVAVVRNQDYYLFSTWVRELTSKYKFPIGVTYSSKRKEEVFQSAVL